MITFLIVIFLYCNSFKEFLFQNFRWRAGDTVSSEDQLAIGDEARMDESTLSQAPSFSNLAAMADKPTAQLQVRSVHVL